MSRRRNPLVPGFDPDPSIVLADGAYQLVTSTFEYLPGIPVSRSTGLAEWTQIGNPPYTETPLVATITGGTFAVDGGMTTL